MGVTQQQDIFMRTTGPVEWFMCPMTFMPRQSFTLSKLVNTSQQENWMHVFLYFSRNFEVDTCNANCASYTLLLPTTIISNHSVLPRTKCAKLGGVMLIIFVPFCLIYCQHLRVLKKTFPWVLCQPVILNLRTDNKHLKVAITSLEGAYLSACNSGIRLVSQVTAKIEFHIFSPKAVENMKWTKVYSIVYSMLTTLACVWAAALHPF